MAKKTKEEKKAAKAEKRANRDPQVTNTIIKSVVAVICAAAVCITTTNCIGKLSAAKISAAETMAKAYSTEESADEGGSSDTGDVTGGDVTDTPTEETTEAVTDENGTPASEETTAAGDNGSSAKSGSSVPKTTAEILNVYNNATAKAAKAGVPFSKTRNTTEKKYEAGVALKTFKSVVYKFMGVGDGNQYSKDVTSADKDSYHKYLKASTLKESDVTSATCTPSGDNYTIVIKVKDGASSVKGGKVVNSNNAPIDRSGLACGDNDKDYWDHKTAENIYSAIADVAKSADISEKYSNTVITAVINAKTGNIVSLSAKFDFHVDIANVMGSSGVAEASSVVNMKNFKY